MTLKQLQAKARKLEISGRSKMNKSELEAAIAKAEKKVPETVEEFGVYLGTLTKGEARRERKKQFALGRHDLARAERKAA